MRKFKEMMALLLTLVLAVLFSTAALADDSVSGTRGENVIWALEDGVLTISGTGAIEDYASRDDIPWYPFRESITTVVIDEGITSIGRAAFYNCVNLTSVTIPDSVTSIGDYVFYNCTGLTSVTIPDSVTSIGIVAFYNCASLTSVTIPDSIVSIGSVPFYDCQSLNEILVSEGNTAYTSEDGILFNYDKTVLVSYPAGKEAASYTIPDSVTSIGESAFNFCTSLTSVTIPDSITFIGNGAFYACTGLTSVTIPDSVTTISGAAFHGCTSLTSITIPDSVTSIGSDADGSFSDCTNLTEILVSEGNTAYTSEDGVLFNYDKTVLVSYPAGIAATSYTIPSGVTSIGIDAFLGCGNLTDISIADSVTSIGGWAFYSCDNLRSVAIPSLVTSIGESAFEECSSLSDIYYGGGEEEWKAIEIGEYNECLTSVIIHYNSTGVEDEPASAT